MKNIKQEDIDKILDELYQIDPGLKTHGPSLKEAVAKLLELLPEAKINPEFVKILKEKLLAQGRSQKVLSPKFNQPLIIRHMKKLNYVLSGVFLVIVVIAGSYYLIGKPGQSDQPGGGKVSLLSERINITPAGPNAFGMLNQSTASTMSISSPLGMGAGTESAAADSAKVAPGFGGGGSATSSIYPPQIINYSYVYKGDEFEISQGNLPVYKRLKSFPSASVSSLLDSFEFGLIDLNSFQNQKLQYLGFVEDRDWGYMFNLQMDEGSLNINENWNKWPVPGRNCQDQSCYEANRVRLEDIPEDQTVINLANQFLSEHNISTANYGPGEVDNRWRRDYENYPDKSQYYIPEAVSVIYPLLLNGESVYDESGNKTGFYVSVNIKVNRVSSVYNLTSQDYQSSEYELETDVARLIGVAEKGGYRNYVYQDPAATETSEFELGTPKIAYVKIWQYQGNLPNELLVPALIFPITKYPSSLYAYWRESVIVPLTKELLEEQQNPPVMPLIEKDVPEATTPSQSAQ